MRPWLTDTIGDDAQQWQDLSRLPLRKPALQVVAGISHSCALLMGGDVVCWGDYSNGDDMVSKGHLIGDEPGELASQPVEQTGGAMLSLSLTDSHACGLRQDGEVMCSPGHPAYALTLPGHPYDPEAEWPTLPNEWRIADLALPTDCNIIN